MKLNWLSDLQIYLMFFKRDRTTATKLRDATKFRHARRVQSASILKAEPILIFFVSSAVILGYLKFL